MTEHTPGPWEAIELLPDGIFIRNEGYEIRTAIGSTSPAPDDAAIPYDDESLFIWDRA